MVKAKLLADIKAKDIINTELNSRLTAALADIKRLEADVEQRNKYLADIKVRIESYNELLRRLADSEAAIKRRDDILAEIADGKMYTGPSTCNCEICSRDRREWIAAKLKEAT